MNPVKQLPFVAAVAVNNMLYISGQVGVDPVSGTLTNSSFTAEAHQVMKNIGQVLEAHKLAYHHLVHVTIYLTNMDNYAETNAVYSQYFNNGYPARVCIAVKQLPLNASIEITAIARLL